MRARIHRYSTSGAYAGEHARDYTRRRKTAEARGDKYGAQLTGTAERYHARRSKRHRARAQKIHDSPGALRIRWW